MMDGPAISQITISKKRPQSTDQRVSTFWRKTARGKVQKVLREHYLRPASDFPAVPAHVQTWAVIDTNVVLHQIDLISSPAFPLPLLVPQTVLDEVRHRSLPLYNRLKNLLDDDFVGERSSQGKRGWIVWNEAMEETYLVREKGESPNDRNDRAIRHLASYYSAILTANSSAKRSKTSSSSLPRSTDTSVFLLTDDADNKRKAIADGLKAYTVREYVEAQSPDVAASLMDLIAAVGA